MTEVDVNVQDNHKPIPRSVLIFGAGNHIGTPLARFLQQKAPQIKLRLVSSRPDGVEVLRQRFPEVEVISANYLDRDSLGRAVEGMEGVFVNVPAGTDERPVTTNLIAALKQAGSAVHILRTLGMQPEANLRRIHPFLRGGLSLPVQHPIVKQLFDESDLPVTYLNFGATFLDNFFWMRASLVKERKLVWHNRMIPFIDPRDIAEVAATLLLSDNHRHLYTFHTLNNGHDQLRFEDVARIMSEVFGETVTYDGSREGFYETYAHMGPLRDVLWGFFEYERENEEVWAPNTFVERILGRKPTTVRQWLEEHKAALLAPLQPGAGAGGPRSGSKAP